MKQRLEHYRQCQHPDCKARLDIWNGLVAQAKAGGIKAS